MKDGRFLNAGNITPEVLGKVGRLAAIAQRRGQTTAQLALAWVLRQPTVTSALVGASRPEQILDAVGTLQRLDFSEGELAEIDAAVK